MPGVEQQAEMPYLTLALGSGQRLLCRLGSGLGLVLVLRFCAYSYGGVYS